MNDAVASVAFAPGFVKAMPGADYHRIEAMSSGGASRMIRSPQHFRLMRDTPNEPSAVQEFGTVVHCGVLEPDKLGDVCVVYPPGLDGRTKEGKAIKAHYATEHAGRIALANSDWIRADSCIAAVRAHPIAAKLLADAEGVEESLFWVDGKYNVPCKARWDLRSRGGIVDLKTTKDASPETFARDAASFMFHIQEAHYRNAAEAVLNESPRFFVFIAVESEPPHAVACYYLPPEAVRVGQGWMDVALERYAKALASGKWEGYPQSIDQLPFPRWALRVNT